MKRRQKGGKHQAFKRKRLKSFCKHTQVFENNKRDPEPFYRHMTIINDSNEFKFFLDKIIAFWQQQQS